jgi:arsenate reductase
MEKLILYHNPACSKSRAALELLQSRSAEFEIREYLDQPLSGPDLENLLELLDDEPGRLVRRDRHFAELGLEVLEVEEPLGSQRVVEILSEHPRLMERPVLASGSRAMIGRPTEKLLAMLES